MSVRACRLLSPYAAPPAHILHDPASGEESIDDIVRALENGTVRDLHVRELDLSGTNPFPRRTTAPLLRLAHSSRPPAPSIFSQHTTKRVQPKNAATAGCLRGAGGRVKVGTRAWDGLLEALRANLIDALFVNGMFSYAVWLAQPFQDVHYRRDASARRADPVCAHAPGEARADGGVIGMDECRVRAVSTAWCVVQATTSKPRALLRWRRRSKATRRCRRSTCECATGQARPARVVVGTASASAGSEHGVVGGAGNGIEAKGAVALAAALKGNTTLLTLFLSRMWTARCMYFAGMGGRSGDLASARAGRRERLVGVVGTASASAGSEHVVVGGAGNRIEAEGAVALAAALQGNTTLQTLVLGGMWTARTRVFCGNGAAAPGTSRAGMRERLLVVVGTARREGAQ